MPAPDALPKISAATRWFFARIARRYLRRHFRSVMGQNLQAMRDVPGPLIVYMNHASWWDAMVAVFLASELLPQRNHYAPMDAASLKKYPIFRKIGAFPVELGSGQRAAEFLQTAEAVLHANGVLWITPQGRFVDARQRPLRFKHGLASLAARVPEAKLLPLAIDYTFWDERLPELLLRCGDVQHGGTTADLEQALEQAMDALREAAVSRTPASFQPLLRGGRGTGGVYGFWRRLRGIKADHSNRGT